jgi:hypothetical protein
MVVGIVIIESFNSNVKMENLIEKNNLNIRELSVEEMVEIEGGGCAGFAAGVIATFASAFVLPVGLGIAGMAGGVLTMIDEAAACEKYWFS